MSGRVGAFLATVAVGLCAAVGSSSGRQVRTTATLPAFAAAAACAPAGASVRASDGQAQIYALHGVIYGCDRRTHARRKLGRSRLCTGSARVDLVTLAGDKVAYGLIRCGVDSSSAVVNVLRLSNGKQLHSYAAVTGMLRPESSQSLGSLVAKSDAQVAWIVIVSSVISQAVQVEVYRDGSLLDGGPGVQPGSLRLHGSTLTWRHGSSTRTANLS